MGDAVIDMGMMVALGLCDYRQAGLLKRLGSTPASPYEYPGSRVAAKRIIAVIQSLIVPLAAGCWALRLRSVYWGWVSWCFSWQPWR